MECELNFSLIRRNQIAQRILRRGKVEIIIPKHPGSILCPNREIPSIDRDALRNFSTLLKFGVRRNEAHLDLMLSCRQDDSRSDVIGVDNRPFDASRPLSIKLGIIKRRPIKNRLQLSIIGYGRFLLVDRELPRPICEGKIAVVALFLDPGNTQRIHARSAAAGCRGAKHPLSIVDLKDCEERSLRIRTRTRTRNRNRITLII
ncbi:MAG: hypothetical protein M2R45_02603 [Verrucomicrobia subdivision 3 bacterium]|nr:hypothetical protein [Limisphaerales bacterium]MCS1416429.1 hypothetical protein [Limisphaerales bacterium]